MSTAYDRLRCHISSSYIREYIALYHYNEDFEVTYDDDCNIHITFKVVPSQAIKLPHTFDSFKLIVEKSS